MNLYDASTLKTANKKTALFVLAGILLEEKPLSDLT